MFGITIECMHEGISSFDSAVYIVNSGGMPELSERGMCTNTTGARAMKTRFIST